MKFEPQYNQCETCGADMVGIVCLFCTVDISPETKAMLDNLPSERLTITVDSPEDISALLAAKWRKVLPPTPIDEIDDMLAGYCCPN